MNQYATLDKVRFEKNKQTISRFIADTALWRSDIDMLQGLLS